MNRKNALQMVENCRITSLGKFAHGYVVYQQASNGIINQVFDHFEAQIKALESKIVELEESKDCNNTCIYFDLPKTKRWAYCNDCSRNFCDNYEANSKQVKDDL